MNDKENRIDSGKGNSKTPFAQPNYVTTPKHDVVADQPGKDMAGRPYSDNDNCGTR